MQNLHLLEYSAEAFLCHVHHYQCLVVPSKLAGARFSVHSVWNLVLNDQLHYKTHTLFDTITHASITNISAVRTTMNQKTNPIAASSTGTAKH